MARTYEKTHPWITFRIDPERFPAELWFLLGEARSKCAHLAGVPLLPATAQSLMRIYLAKGVLATTAIEGNTLSVEQVEEFLRGTLELPPSKEYLKTEVDNIVKACNWIVEHAIANNGLPLSVDVIQSFNRAVLDRLELKEEVVPGRIRQYDVGVARYRGAPWSDCPYLLERLVTWLGDLDRTLPEFLGTAKAILRAVLSHLYIAWIHPFGDGNGRTARLVEFAILVNAGIPIPAAHLLSDHYNETRTKYYLELDRASRSGGDVVPFICYAVRGFIDGVREQIKRITEQQLTVAWQNYVHERLHQTSETGKRRKKLVFALTNAGRDVRVKDLPLLTPDLAILYAKKTPRTVARDINALTKQGLVKIVKGGLVRANRDLMRAFLPGAVTDA